jgi:hypothetical protein
MAKARTTTERASFDPQDTPRNNSTATEKGLLSEKSAASL